MKTSRFLILLVAMAALFTSCTKVPAGYVGVKVYLLGASKGVDQEVIPVGRYWIGINEELFTFPTYQVNYVYTASVTEGSPTNEEYTFQTKEGMECSMDLGLSMHFDKDNISKMYSTYLKGEEEIRGVVVRNAIRDALNKVAGSMPIEYVYGEGKGIMVDSVQQIVSSTLKNTGIIIDKIYLIGSIRIPSTVKDALDAKVTATQLAQKAENEVQRATAEAQIAVAQAKGRSESVLVEANAQAEANVVLAKSITPALIQYKAIEKWNGSLPTVSGGNTPFINLQPFSGK